MNYICAALERTAIAVVASGFEKEHKKTNIGKLAIYLAIYMIFYAVNFHFQIAIEASLGSYLLLFMYLKLSYKEDFLHTLMVTVASGVFAGVIEYLVTLLVLFVIPSGREIGIFELAVTVPTFLLSVLVSRFPINKFLEVLEKWEFTYVIIALLSLMIFSPYLLMQIARKVEVIDFVYIIICIFMMWLLVFKVQRYKLESKIRRQYFEGYKDVITQIRRRQHKIKNQINTAYSMFLLYDTYDELVSKQKEYLSHILDYELPNDAVILEEPSIIALIYEKINEASSRNIHVNTSFSSSMSGSSISDVIWVELIGTLLDNAIEALDHYEGEKILWLEIGYAENHKLAVRVVNTFDQLSVNQISRFFEMGFSTKGIGRGVGLYNIKNIICKQNGNITARSTERDGKSVIIFEIII